MAEPFDRLDEFIDAVLSRPDAALPAGDPELAPLARLATDLRDLPRASFKERLREDLKRRASMSTATVSPIREGFRTVTPYLVVRQGAELIDFLKQAFGAVETARFPTGGGGFHAEVQIGDSMLMVGGGPVDRNPQLAALQHYVENPDEVYERALRFGATSLQAPIEDHGERFACVEDPFGNRWYIGRSLGPSYRPEGLNDVNLFLHPVGAAKFIEFLERAFGAVTVERHEPPGGIVYHAKLQVGDSVIEMSEAHSWWQPLPTMVMMYVPDADAVYQQALRAGATSLHEPVDLPYGRSAAVTDPAGNIWYSCTPPSGSA